MKRGGGSLEEALGGPDRDLQCLEGAAGEMGRASIGVCRVRTGGNGVELKEGGFRRDTRRKNPSP